MDGPDQPTTSTAHDPWAPPDVGAAPTARVGQPGSAPGWGAPAGWGAPPPSAPPGWGAPQGWGAAPGWAPPGWGWAPPPVDPRARRRRRVVAVAALTGVALLLVGALTAVTVAEDRRADRVATDVADVLPELMSFVEAERGLPFLADVDVEVLDDDDFLDALYAEPPSDRPSPREDLDPDRTLVALGLVDEDVDLDEAFTESIDDGVVGFYDPITEALVVRGREVDAFVELILVHELTHALQDQHFDIDRPELDEATDERSFAFRSLVEGDATRVESAWLQAQPADRQEELFGIFEELGAGGGGEPIVEEILGFPYYGGEVYVLDVLDDGGQEALDALFAQPPVTTEQVLRPGQPDELAAPVVVDRPDGSDAQAGELVDEGVLGQLGLALLLGEDPLEGEGASDGWGGDAYVTTERDDRTCTTVDVVSDTPDAAAGLRDALEDWATAQPDGQVTDGPDGAVRLTSCTSG